MTVVQPALKAPFPYFGGKRRVAHLVWELFGDTHNYVEPFAGSLAVLLGRPHKPRVETVNDKDCYLSNFWRALKHDPGTVAKYADCPVNETDLSARHQWLMDRDEWREKMKTDPGFYNAKIAGWWVWGLSCWIGSGWCVDNHRKRVHLETAGKGINRQKPHLGNRGQGINRRLPDLGNRGKGIQRQRRRPVLSSAGRGLEGVESLADYMVALSDRLRRVRVCCGDFERILGPSPTVKLGTTAVFLDPPYSDDANRTKDIYAEDCGDVAHRACAWAIENGDNPALRIVLCGYEGEHDMPSDWGVIEWKAPGGYAKLGIGAGTENCHRERLWYSPHCIQPVEKLPMPLFDEQEATE